MYGSQSRALGLGILLVAGGCNQEKTAPNAALISTLDLQLVDPPPTGLGSPSAPVDVQSATFNLIARDRYGNPITSDVTVDVYISFGGVLTGANAGCGADESGADPIETVKMPGGMLMNHTVMLPAAYGATALWVSDNASGATGASPTIYFRNAFIAEAQTPPDLTAMNASFCSSFNGKFLTFDHATASGQLVVTSVFDDSFSITDTGVAPGGFNNMYIFSYSQPPPEIVEGRVITTFSGNYSKFVGFTELNFPLFSAADSTVPLATVPPPVLITYQDIGNVPKMLGNTAGVVSFTGVICDPDPPNPTNDPNIADTIKSWEMYNQFVVDNDQTCSSFTNIGVELPAKVLGTFDPLQVVG
ncbi:MAG TPA: hypothetical protein VGL86_30130, partial [Polyangia bacterium]